MPIASREFLNKMREEGKKHSGGGGAGIVGRVLIEFGLHRYVSGHDFWSFWKPTPDPDDVEDVKQELSGRLQQAGCGDSPNFGLKITIRKDVLGKDEPYKDDLKEFVPDWQEDSFGLVCDAMEQGNLLVHEEFFGRVEYKANPYFVKQGEAGKKDKDQNGNPRYPSVRVPVERFADEAAARAAVGGGSSSNGNTQWSAKAMEAFANDEAAIEGSATEAYTWYKKALEEKVPYNNDAANFPLPSPPTPPNIKKYIATIYSLEAADLDQVIPF